MALADFGLVFITHHYSRFGPFVVHFKRNRSSSPTFWGWRRWWFEWWIQPSLRLWLPYRSVTILTLTFWWFWGLLTPLIHKIDIKILWREDCYLEIDAHFKMFDSFVNRQSYDRYTFCMSWWKSGKYFETINNILFNYSFGVLVQTFTLQCKNYFSLTMSTIIYRYSYIYKRTRLLFLGHKTEPKTIKSSA